MDKKIINKICGNCRDFPSCGSSQIVISSDGEDFILKCIKGESDERGVFNIKDDYNIRPQEIIE